MYNNAEDMMILILLAMLFIGPLQVLWAVVHAAATRFPWVRRQFAYYGLGVIAYFLIVFGFSQVELMDFQVPMFNLHFFGGAGALFCYHCYIVATSARLQKTAQFQADLAHDQL